MSLIDQLVSGHHSRPWWKEFLRPIWFISLILWYVTVAMLGNNVGVHSTYLMAGIIMGLSVCAFAYYCSLNQLHVPRFLPAIGILFLLTGIFFESSLFSYGRGFAPQGEDVSCFMHACLYSLGPVILFPLIDRQFFFTEKRIHTWSILLFLAFAGVLLIDLKCANRDAEHILLGHMTPIFGIGFAGFVALTFWKRFRARPSSHGGGIL